MSRRKLTPSKEDFARAKAIMRSNDRGLSKVRNCVLSKFGEHGLHEFFILYSPKANKFRAFVFYSSDSQIDEAEKSGLSSIIKNAVLESLKDVGRGQGDRVNVEFEFDSHENVEAKYHGDYYSRLR